MVARVRTRNYEKAVSTPRGPARAMTALTPGSDYRFSAPTAAQPNVQFSYTGQSWFGPLPPMHPIAPPEVAGRQFDYLPGYNLTTQPRAYDVIDFQTLRNLAESYDPLRVIIERRKDQMLRLQWTVRIKHDGSKATRPKFKDLNKVDQDRIAYITNMFKRPDGQLPYRGWMRALLEDYFVIDAPAIYMRRTKGGDLHSMLYMDGGTIKRVIDDWGRTPEPIAFTGPFQWDGETITADNFAEEGFKYHRGLLYPPAYQQVLKGLPALNYSTFELYYRPANMRPNRVYGYSPVEQVMATVNTAMRRQYSQLEYYREGNMPEGIVSLPEAWSPDQVQRFQDYWDNLLSGNLGARRHIKFVPGVSGQKWTPMKEPPLKNEFDEWLARVIALAFSYPPNSLVSLSNRSIADQHAKQAEEEGLAPIKEWASEIHNEIITNEFGWDDLEYVYEEEDEVDQEKQEQIITGYVTNGVLTINEAREMLGREPQDNEMADQLIIKTNVGFVPVEANSLDYMEEKTKRMQALQPDDPGEGGGDGAPAPKKAEPKEKKPAKADEKKADDKKAAA